MSDLSQRPGVLVIVGTDFGELSNTLQLLEGTRVRARVMLAAALHAQNPDLPGLAVELLRSRDQVLEAIRTERPRVLLLMTGYFLVAQQLLGYGDLESIVQVARGVGVRVVTSDPLLGCAAHVADAAAVRGLLAEAVHVHLAPAPRTPLSRPCHNPRVVLSAAQRASLAENLGEMGVTLAPPFWLFVISGMDYRLQCRLQGRAQLDARLQAFGRQARAAGRQPVFLIPPLACESLAGEASGAALTLPFCSYRSFLAVLLHAEHVFFWNILSNSVLIRVANGGSVFFFDEGHMARFIPALRPLALESYYRDAPLPWLDPAQSLDAQFLEQAAAGQPATFAPALEALQSLPTPDQWFEGLLHEAQP